MDEIRIVHNEVVRNDDLIKEEDEIIKHFNKDEAKIVHQYHKTLPEYKPTPLRDLSSLSRKLNLKNIWVKDESKRFHLNAFKVLGASFAFAKYILRESRQDEVTFQNVLSKVKQVKLEKTFIFKEVLLGLVVGNCYRWKSRLRSCFHCKTV